MRTISSGSDKVLRGFIAAANEQYRATGLSEYQMHLRKDGTVESPTGHAKRVARGSTATAQAAHGASGAASPHGASSGAAAAPAGPAPQITNLEQGANGSFRLSWQPVQGAKQYGVWRDGALIGHVPNPSFAATVSAGPATTVEIDAVLPSGGRTARTPALAVAIGADGKLQFAGPQDAQSASPAAAAPGQAAAGASTAPAQQAQAAQSAATTAVTAPATA